MKRIAPIAGLLIAAAGCADQGPTMYSLAGEYEATTFTATDADGFTNLLATGGTIEITLTANGATIGRLVVPGGAEGGETLDADLRGTWTLVNEVVHLHHDADTFLRDMPFTVSGSQLMGEEVFGGRTVRVVLTKQTTSSTST